MAKRKRPKAPPAAPLEGTGLEGTGLEGASLAELRALIGDRVRSSATAHVRKIVDDYPDEAVAVLRAWMRQTH